MQNAINSNRKLVIWPVSPEDKIDINDMIMMGLSRKELMTIIETNVYSGIRAKLMFTKWKRV